MGSVAILPRTFLHRMRWGTAVFYDRRQGLLARDEGTGRWRAISAQELRRGYPAGKAGHIRAASRLAVRLLHGLAPPAACVSPAPPET